LRAQELEKGIAKQTIDLRTQNETIEALLKSKKHIFANVSHEFRTPLTLILGSIDNLLDKEINAHNVTQFSLIKRNSKRLLNMVNQLLELARIDSPAEATKQYYSLSATIEHIVAAFDSSLQSKNLMLNIHPFIDVKLFLIRDSLEKMLINLLANAIKYTPASGRIEININTAGNHIEIMIKDSGQGIAKEDHQAVFQLFSRISQTQQDEQTGTGIGLALVKELAKANNGWITLVSELNKGAEFTLCLPYVELNHQADNELAFKESRDINIPSDTVDIPYIAPVEKTKITFSEQSKSLTVLIVEDNRDMRNFLVNSFNNNYHCIVAKNGEQGVSLAQEIVPDLIISDVMMPGIDGFEVVTQLRQNEKTCHIPIILLTAKGDVENKIKGWERSVDDYIAKPFDQKELAARVDNLLTIRNILKKNFGRTISTINPLDSPNIVDISTQDQEFIARFEKFIAENYHDESFNRTKVSFLMSMSERQLNRKLSAITDHNFSNYLRKYRLRKSLAFLGQGYQVAQISDKLGFSAVSYFNKCFKDEYGKSVKQYEKEHK
jgi:DNA-binding response OmpR family regulator